MFEDKFQNYYIKINMKMEYFYIIIIDIILNVEIYFYQFNCEFANAKSEIF